MAAEALYANGLMIGQARKSTGKTRRFLWHLLQMVIAMEIGMGIYHLLVATVFNRMGYAELRNSIPLLTYWMMVLAMTLGMLVLMRYQKSTSRYCLEMTLAMVAPLVVLSLLVAANLLSIQVLRIAGDPVMILAMAIFMHYRPHEHGHGAHEESCHTA